MTKYKKENIGLYRDDGLAVFDNVSGPEMERIKKDLQKVFKRNGLNITIQCNKKIVDYLDITFNLNDGSYRPYRKPNDVTIYIHKESNHPPTIIRKLPSMVEKRVSELSSTKEIFEEAKSHYEEALGKSGFDTKLNYVPREATQRTKKNRQRKIIWYNPPFSKNVKTNIATEFLKLVDKHFPKRHKFYKLFNRNNVKVSYSSMPNMKAIISGHNKNVLKDRADDDEKKCNCRIPEECPLEGQCLTKEVMYEATVNADIPQYETRTYKGITERTFKERYKEHKKTFNHRKYENDTELSKEIWKIKNVGGTPDIKWKILKKASSYNPKTKKCMLCLTEKLAIAEHEGRDLLNKRSEIIAKCRHQNKFTLLSIDSND